MHDHLLVRGRIVVGGWKSTSFMPRCLVFDTMVSSNTIDVTGKCGKETSKEDSSTYARVVRN